MSVLKELFPTYEDEVYQLPLSMLEMLKLDLAIGAAADLMGITPSEMHNRLDKVGLVKNLLFDLYDVEHTQSLEYVAEDVVEALNNWEKT